MKLREGYEIRLLPYRRSRDGQALPETGIPESGRLFQLLRPQGSIPCVKWSLGRKKAGGKRSPEEWTEGGGWYAGGDQFSGE